MTTLKSAFRKTAAGLALGAGAAGAMAHEGHGLAGAHWHASDTLGFVLVVVLAAAAVWISRR